MYVYYCDIVNACYLSDLEKMNQAGSMTGIQYEFNPVSSQLANTYIWSTETATRNNLRYKILLIL